MTAQQLFEYVNANEKNRSFVDDCWAQAVVMVENFVGLVDVPELILGAATVAVGAELFYKRSAPSGVQQFGTPDGTTGVIRIARDPMLAAKPMLAPYVGWGIG